MSFDNTTGGLDRNQLLDEIRRRAEQAELARIEVEEAKLGEGYLDDPSSLSPTNSSSYQETEESLAEQRVQRPDTLLKVDVKRASASHNEFIPLHSTQAGVEELKAHTVDATHDQSVRKSKPAKQGKAKRKQRIAGLLTSAHENYQRENYERALDELGELLTLDPENTAAAVLNAEVEKAKALSDRLREEEQRRRMEEQEAAKMQFVPPPRKKKEECSAPTVEAVSKDREFIEAKGEERQTAAAERPQFKRSFTWLAFAALVLLGAVTSFVVYDSIRNKFFPPQISVLVLPPVTANVDAYVAEGLMDELIVRLSHIGTLRVFAAKTALGLDNGDGVKSAQLLGADLVVQWTVSEAEGTLNVKLSIVDAASSKHNLDQSLKLSSSKLAEFSGDVATGIARAIGVDARESNAAFKSSSTNHHAYDRYLLGRYLLNHPQLAPLDSIASVFEQSRQSDPLFPYAEAAMGWTNVLMHEASADTSRVCLNEAAKNLQRAMNLGASSSEVYRLWGVVEYFRSNYRQAVERLEHATMIAPSDAELRRRLALAYLRTGRHDDALDAGRAAVETDPHSHQSRSLLGGLFLLNGESKAALQEFETDFHLQQDSLRFHSDEYLAALVATNHHERALDILKDRTQLNPRDFAALYDLGRMLQLAGKQKSDWEKVLQQSLQLIGDTLKVNPKLALAYSYRGLVQTRLGRFAEGVKSNKQAIEAAPTDIVILYNSARMYALQRNKSSEALNYLAKGIHRRLLLERLLDLDLLSLRNDPEFGRRITQ
jgi:tetratricopeptide (TPR) repeat protein